MEKTFYLGVLVGIAAGLVVVGLLHRKQGKKATYDERQEAARGRAYRCAYQVGMLYGLVFMGMLILSLRWCQPAVGVFIGIALSGAVCGVRCVLDDAYFPLHCSHPQSLAVLLLGAGINLGFAIRWIWDGSWLTDGVLGIKSMNLIAGLLVLAILIAVLVRWRQERCGEQGEMDER